MTARGLSLSCATRAGGGGSSLRHRAWKCGSRSFRAEPMAASGVVYAMTIVRIPLPGHEAPTSLAYVDVEPGARALGVLRGAARIGDTVAVLSCDTSPTGVAFEQVTA